MECRDYVKLISQSRKEAWRRKCSKVAPEENGKIIPEDQMRIVWKLIQHCFDANGRLIDPRMGMDLVHFIITAIGADR